jgi:hypothetical protein
VPPPRGTTGTPCSAAQRTTAAVSSALPGCTAASALPRSPRVSVASCNSSDWVTGDWTWASPTIRPRSRAAAAAARSSGVAVVVSTSDMAQAS